MKNGTILLDTNAYSRLMQGRDLADFCADSKVVKVYSSEKTTLLYGDLMDNLRKAGTPIPTNDVWIGAYAKEMDAVILSFDHHLQALIPHGVRLMEIGEASHA